MYIRILDYLINTLTDLREKARKPNTKGISAKEWAKRNQPFLLKKEWAKRNKSYK